MVLFISAISLSLQILLDNVIRQIQWRAIQPRDTEIFHVFSMALTWWHYRRVSLPYLFAYNVINISWILDHLTEPSILQASPTITCLHACTPQKKEKKKKNWDAAGIIIVNPIFFIAT